MKKLIAIMLGLTLIACNRRGSTPEVKSNVSGVHAFDERINGMTYRILIKGGGITTINLTKDSLEYLYLKQQIN